MLHEDESEHVAVLAVPSCSLQTAPALHIATDRASSLKSQFEVATQATWLPSPPMPLHSEESLQVTLSASSELPLHFAACVQFKEHASAPHSALQSVPAAHVQAESVHVQPVPVHVGALPSPPQAVTAIAKLNRAMILKGTLFSSGSMEVATGLSVHVGLAPTHEPLDGEVPKGPARRSRKFGPKT